MKILILLICLAAIFLFGINCVKTDSAEISKKGFALKKESSLSSAPLPELKEASLNASFPKKYSEPKAVAEKVEKTATPTIPKYKIRMLMNSEFYEEEVEDKVGLHKNWLGLYRDKESYSLIPSVIKVKVIKHPLRDNEKSKEKTGRAISSNIKLPSVFLLKDAKTLKPGKVETVFYGNEKNSDPISRKYRREFEFKNAKYVLFVEDSGQEEGDYLTKDSRMILVRGNQKQMLYKPDECRDCSWDLCWVGDLDKDEKLDFMLNLNSHYNSTCHTLFLSSQAKKGEIVRDVAELCQMGC